MERLTKREEFVTMQLMAKEFLEYRLGVEANSANIRRFVALISKFEEEIERQNLKQQQLAIAKPMP